MYFKLNIKVHLLCMTIAIALTIVLFNTIQNVLETVFSMKIIQFPTSLLLINFYIFLVLLLVPVSILHELVHGLIYCYFGGSVSFGFKLIFAYTFEKSSKKFKKNEFLLIIMSPVVIISIVSLLIPYPIGALIFIINLLGSCSDLFMAFSICKYPPNCRFIDRFYGYEIVNTI